MNVFSDIGLIAADDIVVQVMIDPGMTSHGVNIELGFNGYSCTWITLMHITISVFVLSYLPIVDNRSGVIQAGLVIKSQDFVSAITIRAETNGKAVPSSNGCELPKWTITGQKRHTFGQDFKLEFSESGSFAAFCSTLRGASRMKKSLVSAEDRWEWAVESKTKFSVKTVKHLIQKHTGTDFSCRIKWVKWVPLKCNVMAWRASVGHLPVKAELLKRNVQKSVNDIPIHSTKPMFVRYGYEYESLNFKPNDPYDAKAGAGSTTLSMAYAAVKFADRYLRGLRGDVDIVDCAFVESRVTELPFFATQVRLGHIGVEEIYQLGPLNEYERYGNEYERVGLEEA
ncbi:hypothetical protein M8C21_022533 [Ambrosia artemisiifolia]|uniref:Lactate/malate dehydrogenase C-terminal domain-containing protein n=1 Tax=Ambrosia artemisiifolia TaxID=4212 RepID=A0AAD5C0M1_AMBAR|nr:hypothetical protein M8C21_022533 [Ambrosia artemisiifolia]